MKRITIIFSGLVLLVAAFSYLPFPLTPIYLQAPAVPGPKSPPGNTGKSSSPSLHLYKIDLARSSILLVANAGVIRAVEKRVSFGSFRGYLYSDGKSIVGDTGETTIEMDSGSAGNRVDTFALKSKILKPKQFPICTMQSLSVKRKGSGNTYRVRSKLSMVGVTRDESFDVVIDFEGDQIRCRSKGFKIRKTDYRMNPPGLKLSEEIEIRIDLVYRKASEDQ